MTGYNLPPGCDTTPGEEDWGCEVCLQNDTNCVCPECPECKSTGDPTCYENNHLELTPEQIAAKDHAEKSMEEQAEGEDEWYKSNPENSIFDE